MKLGFSCRHIESYCKKENRAERSPVIQMLQKVVQLLMAH
ncbi:hypothetical protein V6Z12_A10G027900 [Gossypium hirsutum]